MPKDKYRKPEITHGVKRIGQQCPPCTVTVIESGSTYGRRSMPYTQLQNIPRPLRQIPILNRIGRVVGHCHPALVYSYV